MNITESKMLFRSGFMKRTIGKPTKAVNRSGPTQSRPTPARKTDNDESGLAGPVLFAAVASVLLAFFWWLL
jgi:hypothetical protein